MPIRLVTKGKKMKEPNIKKEMAWSIFKCMFALCFALTIAICGLFAYYMHRSFNSTLSSMEVWQDGANNNQSVTNG